MISPTFRWNEMCDGVGRIIPPSMKMRLLEQHFQDKPLLANDCCHFQRQKDNYNNGLPDFEWKDYNITFLERSLYRSVMYMNKKEAEDQYKLLMEPNKTGRRRNEPSAPAMDDSGGGKGGKGDKGKGKKGKGKDDGRKVEPPSEMNPNHQPRNLRASEELSTICWFFQSGKCKNSTEDCKKEN